MTAPSTAPSIEDCDAALFFAPRLTSEQQQRLQPAPPPLRPMQQQDVSSLQQNATADDPTNYSLAMQFGFLPPLDDQSLRPDYGALANTYSTGLPIDYGGVAAMHYPAFDPNQSNCYYDPLATNNYAAAEPAFGSTLEQSAFLPPLDPAGCVPCPAAACWQPMDQWTSQEPLAAHTTISLSGIQPTIGLRGPVLQRAPSWQPQMYGDTTPTGTWPSDSGMAPPVFKVPAPMRYDPSATDRSNPPSDPDATFMAPTPKPYDASGGIVAVQMCVQPGVPDAPLPAVLQERLQQSAQLGFTQQQQAELSASAVVLWNCQQPFWTPPPEMMAAQQFELYPDVEKEEFDDDFGDHNWSGLNDDVGVAMNSMPFDDVDVQPPPQQHAVVVYDAAAAASAATGCWIDGAAAPASGGYDDQAPMTSSSSPQYPDVARLLQTADCFQGAQKQFVTDLIGTIFTLLQHIRGGGGARAEKEKISINGNARFERASLQYRTRPAIFKFPSRGDTKRSLYLDIAVTMANFSELPTTARTSVGHFVKHVMNVIYLNSAASLLVTAGCTRSTIGLQVLRESSVRVLSNFWMAHFKTTHPQDERDVFDVITLMIKHYLDRKRSETGRLSGKKN